MKFTGKLQNVSKDWSTGQYHITFTVNEPSVLNQVSSLKDIEILDVEAKKHRKKRSLDANGMLWACIGEMAKAMNPPVDKWSVYLDMLKHYGKYTYICVKPNVVEAVKTQWRECEVVGEVDINGQKAIQMLCYFGSSTYNTEEFSRLLDGVIHEMENMNLQKPPSKEMRRVLEEWERMKNGK